MDARVGANDLREFVHQIFLATGLDAFSAEAATESLVGASLRGVDSHGVRLLPHYVQSIERGGYNRHPQMKWWAKYPSFIVLDADNGLGSAAGFKTIDICMERATQYGVAVAGVINSNHPGIMASYVLRAARKGFMAFAFTNTGPKILTHGGKRPYFGTNPIAFACPREEQNPFCLDMATSVIPWNKVEAARKKKGRHTLPEGTAADEEGNPTTDAQQASSLLPTGGYKGYGLAAMVEILCTALLGLAFGHHTIPMYGPGSDMSKPRRIGQFYMVARCDGVSENLSQFCRAVQQMSDEVRSEPPKGDTTAGSTMPMLAGDPEIKEEKRREEEGIPLDEELRAELEAVGRRYGLEFPSVTKRRSSKHLARL